MDFFHSQEHGDLPTLYPKQLQVGDAVALVSPAGPVAQQRVEAAVRVLSDWGLRPRVYPHALGRYSFYAGTDEQRASDLNDALADPEIRAVICNRGGYGVQRIIPHLDFAAVRRDPKLVLGFSDITALHAALWRHTRLATIHGPVGAQLERGGLTNSSVKHVLMTSKPVLIAANPAEITLGVRTSGVAKGILLGGNLSMLSTCIGTSFMPDMGGAILLIEDVNESAYRIDRLLTHLLNCGILQRVAGVAVGQFSEPAGAAGQVSLADVLNERLRGLGVPVLGGLSIGHGDPNIAVPLGTEAILDADAGTLTVAAVCR
ncbi:LD-carboxypeptidase [Pseudomonas sp. NA-150]|uniref:S66 peptidase family protein n=1 Tax=Pseudomonas sp. NA-150 TaxID=3367525 RepID=UPI0037C8D99A